MDKATALTIETLEAERNEVWNLVYALRNAKNVTPGNKAAAAATKLLRREIDKITAQITALEITALEIEEGELVAVDGDYAAPKHAVWSVVEKVVNGAKSHVAVEVLEIGAVPTPGNLRTVKVTGRTSTGVLVK